MKSYVILEWDDHLSSLLEIISVQGHHLKKIICNRPPKIEFSSVYSPILIQSWEGFMTQPDETYLCGFIGNKSQKFHQQMQDHIGIKFAPLIHPSASISPTAKIGLGSVISAGVIIASSVIIGEGCFIGQGVIFGHDTVVENYVTIRAGAKLAGHIKVEQEAFIDMGVSIIEDINIGSNSVVKAGAVVLKDVLSYSIVSGVPAKTQQ